jgi:hypothetical protein
MSRVGQGRLRQDRENKGPEKSLALGVLSDITRILYGTTVLG